MKVLLCLLVSLSLALAGKLQLGAPVAMTPDELTDPTVLEIANFAVSTIDAWTNGIYRSKLVKVVAGRRQLVAGWRYYLDIETAMTTCSKSDMTALEDCPLHPDYTNQICHVDVYDVPWTGHREVLAQGCKNKPTKRQFGGLAGGLHPVDPNGQNVQEIAAFAVDTINEQSNAMFLSKLVQVHSASTQVVAGLNYYLELEIGSTSCYKGDSVSLEQCDFDLNGRVEICTVKVFDQPWTNTREVTEMNCRPKNTVKRQFMPGGLMPADVSHQDVQQMAMLSVDHINGNRNNPSLSKLVEVISAQYQVVAGLKYYLTMEIATTTCSSSDNNVQLADCDVLLGGGRETCDVEVLDQPWMGAPQVLSFSCTPKQLFPGTVKRQFMAGGLMPADVSHQDVQQMALLSVEHINGNRNNPSLSKLVEVISAQYQVVAGLKYYLTMEIGTTTCSSSDNNVQLADCDVLLGGGRETCDVEVLDQPWMGAPQVLSFSCTPKQLFPPTN